MSENGEHCRNTGGRIDRSKRATAWVPMGTMLTMSTMV
jgi:hypothetical protein